MWIQSIEVKNWRSIGHVHLENLASGLNILTGINGRGKSSLVKALRACLFESKHDADNQELRQVVPFGTNHIPEVEVGFEYQGRRYKLRKVFTKRKSGLAELSEYQQNRWVTIESNARAAHDRVRAMFFNEPGPNGIEGTFSLVHLLWLNQGKVEFDDKDVPGPLRDRLTNVLGQLITGEDQVVRKRVESAQERWFTPTGQSKKTSQLVKLHARKSELETELRRIEQECQQSEEAAATFARVERDRAILEQKLRERDQESATLEACRDELLAKQTRHTEVQGHRRFAHQRCEELRDRIKRIESVHQQIQALNQRLADLQEQRTAKQAEKDRVEQQWTERCECVAVHQARHAELIEQLRRLEAIQRHGERTQYLEQLRRSLVDWDARSEQLASLRAMIEGPIPSQADVQQARNWELKRRELQQRQNDAALRLEIEVERDAEFSLAADGEPAHEMVGRPGQPLVASVRRSGQLAIPGWGTVRIERGREDQHGHKDEESLAKVERDLAELLARFGENLDDPEAIDRFRDRHMEADRAKRELDGLERELRGIAPQGRSVLAGEVDQLVIQLHEAEAQDPELAQRTETAIELEQRLLASRRHLFDSEESQRRLIADRDNLQAILGRLTRSLTELETEWAREQGRVDSLKNQVKEEPPSEAVRTELEAAEKDLARLEIEVEQSQLMPEEKTQLERLGEVAQERRALADERIRLTDQYATLKTQLAGYEGLHPRRSEAEAALAKVERKLAAEDAEASAYKHLKKLLEHHQAAGVANVLSPVSRRVEAWIKRLGLDAYREFEMDDRLAPKALVGEAQFGGQIVKLQDESYGTREQLVLLARLAIGTLLNPGQRSVIVLDDPLTHTDAQRLARSLEILVETTSENWGSDLVSSKRTSGQFQILLLTCHGDRYRDIAQAEFHDLDERIKPSL